MEGNKITSDSIDEYIIKFSPEIQEILKMLRKVIKESAPDAVNGKLNHTILRQ